MSNSNVTPAERAKINGIIASITSRALIDEAFLQQLIMSPVKVFSENGINFPEGKEIKVFHDTEKTFHFVVPMKSKDLSDSDVEKYNGMANESGGNDAIQGGARCTKP